MDEDRNVCALCLTDGTLRGWIEENGATDDCDFDADHRSVACVTIEELAEEADRWFQANYQPGGETYQVDSDPDSDRVYYGTEGQPFEEIFEEELGASDDVTDAVIAALPDVSDRDISKGAEAYYTDAHNFELIEAARAREKADQDEYWFSRRYFFEWEDFCRRVQFSSRFFGIKQKLDELFGEPAEYGEGPVKPLYELASSQVLYRARLMRDDLTEEALNASGAAKLGAPRPSGRRAAG
ncbi:hypothetical protein [Tardiphaga alba]|uniref:hypothetical protein n=1 Tax=Tardiphaga alba TaxID=340268 RepID=UPI00201133C0|nr:hypothetical protein [Tardiphaga alba]